MTEARHSSPEAMIKTLVPSYPVYCVRPKTLREATERFLDRFHGRVLYAVKCNPHPMILKGLYDAGIRHFDTASLAEVALIRELFPDAKAYFNHPVKVRAHINTAYRVYDVRHFVVDHEAELAKVIDETGGQDVDILVRMATPEAGAAFHLSAKFGATPQSCVELLQAVHKAGLRAGLAFHVGSQCVNPGAFGTALGVARDVLTAAKVELHYLDVGGGFPAAYLGVDVPPLETFFAAIEQGLKALKLRRDCVLMAEPGRILVADSCTLVTQIALRKDSRLYINDGVYHSLSETVLGGTRLPVRLVKQRGAASKQMTDFTVYGPTCDSTDVLPTPFALPDNAAEGDWIVIDRIGAYSNALSTSFNGFHPETFVEIDETAA